MAELAQVLGQLRQEATAKGLNKITARQINAEVDAVRKSRASRKRSLSGKMIRVVSIPTSSTRRSGISAASGITTARHLVAMFQEKQP
jgi:hypothetical protein